MSQIEYHAQDNIAHAVHSFNCTYSRAGLLIAFYVHMLTLEKVFLVIFMILSALLTVGGFFWEGWPVFLGLTFIASTSIAMLGAWNAHPKSRPVKLLPIKIEARSESNQHANAS